MLGLNMSVYLWLGMEVSIGVSVQSGDLSEKRQQKINSGLLW